MGKRSLLGVALLVVAVLVLGAATARAQGGDPPAPPVPVLPQTPMECVGLAMYDLTGDGRVDWQDFDKWVRQVHWGGDPVYPQCKRDGPARACPLWVDVNGDGQVTVADLDAMHRYMKWCSGLPRTTWPAR